MGLNKEEAKASIRQTLIAAIDLMFESGLSPEQVMDLIPVKPIGEYQTLIADIYKDNLIAFYQKIRS